jgi:hypothetical protein
MLDAIGAGRLRWVVGWHQPDMKRLLLFLAVAAAVAGVLLAQSIIDGKRMDGRPWSYDPKTVPPLALPEAFAMAVHHIGKATNRFHCVAASCLEMTNDGFTGWTFRFSDTNGQRGRVNVYFDRKVETVRRIDEILISE